jgi:hypothetical protein
MDQACTPVNRMRAESTTTRTMPARYSKLLWMMSSLHQDPKRQEGRILGAVNLAEQTMFPCSLVWGLVLR